MKPFTFFLPLTALFLSASVAPEKKDKFVSIEKLAAEKRLDVTIRGLGGYQQECVEFTLKNQTSDTLFIHLEPGRRLHSIDTTAQDILIVKRKQLTLLPHASTTTNGYGFCCKSHHHSPNLDSEFTIGTMAPAGWQQLANVINDNPFPPAAIQAAVWSLSNDHPLSAIAANDPAATALLRNTVGRIKGIDVPWYTVAFEHDDQMLFSNRHELLTGEIRYQVNSNTTVSIVVKNKAGQTVKTLIKGLAAGSGEHTYDLHLAVAGWPKGDYVIYVYEDYSNLNKKMAFTL